ncbi:ABC transporter substrate-binding protein [Achromobacter xylosoxidans]|jgi:branched-chain amino acid transport system substrate-binding protein|uniref:ABC transporter substrate-binding protein n=2 Tax=Burkholderiales TaxID=80840 RepID=A0A0D6INC3_ALCXX|nr:ABC transporter substrate-binding protein [Achromobacter xylosoxidans]AHC49931.1 Leucine-, isoleucine-, valine-, threonine-, and alanine-binding protein [Achromobacter xylosoxidans NBRC 15126 = ATCC 27061]AUZ18986.1 ABC transporter permease [Achromobacter xylosoxidans]AXA77182.1 glutamate racemase [Achromobacter xylosoxidans]MCH1985306.1 ABC transporter substrate-binding protein [Achromobacter xylosoxidans]MCH1993954.1 ABC transporter substrate-binding protein [Achromobacter xylosoxidans]
MLSMPRRFSRAVLAGAIAGALLHAGAAQAQVSDDVIRIGFITDMSGVYSGPDGPGGAEAIKMAIEEMGGEINGKKIELLTADHQNKADIASAKAREWFDQRGLDMLIGGTNSSTALAMSKVAADKKKPIIVVGAGAPALTNEQCTPYTLNYAYDTVAQARGTGAAVVKAGGKSWYILTADYAFGHALQADTTKVVEAGGGKVVGSVKHPLSTSDFSSFLLQAQASKAEILALANAGADATNAIKAANEFGLTKTMRLAGMIMFINDIHAMGLETAKGMYLTDSWYWNASDETRAWAQKFYERRNAMPSSLQAADYSAAIQYLRAVKATGTDDADKVLAYLRENKLDDVYIKNGVVRPDGRVVHDMYLLQVKTPEESKAPWDYFKVVQTIDGNEAFTTKAETRCALWK